MSQGEDDDPGNNCTRIQLVQFDWEDEPQPRAVRLARLRGWWSGACDDGWRRSRRTHRGYRVIGALGARPD